MQSVCLLKILRTHRREKISGSSFSRLRTGLRHRKSREPCRHHSRSASSSGVPHVLSFGVVITSDDNLNGRFGFKIARRNDGNSGFVRELIFLSILKKCAIQPDSRSMLHNGMRWQTRCCKTATPGPRSHSLEPADPETNGVPMRNDVL
jgi:hypothetical protein